MKLPLPTLHRHFRFEIAVTEGDKTFTLPLGTGTHNFTVYWGDGSSDEITSSSDPDRIHTYATAGTYIISMRGICTHFAFNNAGDKLKLKKLLGFIDMGFTILNFRGCSNLTRVHSSMRVLRSLTTALSMFRVCTSLVSIPAGIFDGAANITSFEESFRNCESLTAIPTGLFDNNTAVTTFKSAFVACGELTSIPIDLFRYNTVVTSFDATFYGCIGLTSIPTDLFANNTLVTTFENVFFECTSLTAIPTGLFDNNTAVTRLYGVFRDCSSLTSIPTGLFDNNTAVTTFNGTFMGCTSLLSIPSGLFDNNIEVNNFYSVFRDCPSINQALDGNIFLYNDKVDDFRYAFQDCSKLTGLGWQTIIANAEAQETPPTYTDDCFLGATSLTDYDDIPEAWK